MNRPASLFEPLASLGACARCQEGVCGGRVRIEEAGGVVGSRWSSSAACGRDLSFLAGSAYREAWRRDEFERRPR